jgi:mannose-1-phosphate guanylyltransferase
MSSWAIILAGGAGTRFWPLSTPARPKQLLPLATMRPLALEAVDRLDGLIPRERILLVTGAALAAPLREALRLPLENVLVEPRAASTAPALAWATVEAERRDPDAVVLSVHADWAVGDAAAFRRSGARALAVATGQDALVTVGIVPSRPETGYGYIVPGDPLEGDARRVARFTEKPDAATAAAFIRQGALWNSGLFAWSARRLRAELTAVTPEVAPHLPLLGRNDVVGFFAAVTPVSIDVGVLERSGRVAVVPGAFPWDDVGTWDALPRVRGLRPDENVTHGPVFADQAEGCVLWTDGDPIVVRGVKDLVVVHANGRILVVPRAQAAELKQTLDALPPNVLELK